MWSNATSTNPTNIEPTDFGWIDAVGHMELKWFEGLEVPNVVADITIPLDEKEGMYKKHFFCNRLPEARF